MPQHSGWHAIPAGFRHSGQSKFGQILASEVYLSDSMLTYEKKEFDGKYPHIVIYGYYLLLTTTPCSRPSYEFICLLWRMLASKIVFGRLISALRITVLAAIIRRAAQRIVGA